MRPDSRQRALEGFARIFPGDPGRAVAASGRVELLGNHTDYNRGLVLAFALAERLTLVGRATSDARIHIISESELTEADFTMETVRVSMESISRGDWRRFVFGMALELEVEGLVHGGFQGWIASDIPTGGGLSSSAALLVALAVGLGGLPTGSDDEKVRVARLCQRVEHRWIGVPCGLLDYLAILHGAPECAVFIDFASETVRQRRLPKGGGFFLVDSGVRHRLSEGGYEEIRNAAFSAAERLGKPSLREVELCALRSPMGTWTVRQREVATHVLEENERVARLAGVDPGGCLEEWGHALSASHASSRDLLRNSTPELDTCVAMAAGISGCMGSRLTGGGFGGWTLHLVDERLAGEFPAAFEAAWHSAGRQEIFRCVRAIPSRGFNPLQL